MNYPSIHLPYKGQGTLAKKLREKHTISTQLAIEFDWNLIQFKSVNHNPSKYANVENFEKNPTYVAALVLPSSPQCKNCQNLKALWINHNGLP